MTVLYVSYLRLFSRSDASLQYFEHAWCCGLGIDRSHKTGGTYLEVKDGSPLRENRLKDGLRKARLGFLEQV